MLPKKRNNNSYSIFFRIIANPIMLYDYVSCHSEHYCYRMKKIRRLLPIAKFGLTPFMKYF